MIRGFTILESDLMSEARRQIAKVDLAKGAADAKPGIEEY